MRLPGDLAAPRDFRTFFEDEHRRLFKTLYFVTGDRHLTSPLKGTSWVGSTIRPR